MSSKDEIIAIVLKRGDMLRFAGSWISDSDVVVAALSKDGSALKYVHDVFKHNMSIVLVAVKNKGQSLKYASVARKADDNIVLAAVENDGLSLWHAGPSMKANKAVALAAVKQNGLALQYVSASLKGDIDVCIAAAKQNKSALRFSSRQLLWKNIRVRFSSEEGYSLVLRATHRWSFPSTKISRSGTLGFDADRCILSILMNNGPFHGILVFKLIGECLGISSIGRRLAVHEGSIKLSFALFNQGDSSSSSSWANNLTELV